MNIGLVNEYFPPFAPGGAEWSTLQLGRELVRRRQAVTVITPNYGADARETMDGVQVLRFPYPARLKGRRTLPLRWLASPFFYLWSATQIWFRARQAELDILHAQNKYILPGTWLAARWLRRPVVITLRDTLLICPFGRCLMLYDQVPVGCGRGHLWQLCRREHIEQYVRPVHFFSQLKARLATRYLGWDVALRRVMLGRVDGVVAVSYGLLSLYQAAGVPLGGQAEVIYNIPPEPINEAPVHVDGLRRQFDLGEGPLVLYVGKFSPGKGTGDLLAAARRVIQDVPEAQFALVGGTDLADHSSPNIKVLGRLPNDVVLRLYQTADLVVVPSVWPEPLSRVLLEAMAMGRAVVGTRVGGTPELIEDGYNGLLVARSAPDELAGAITALLKDPERRREMGRAGRRIIHERFHADRSVDRLLSFYRRVGAER